MYVSSSFQNNLFFKAALKKYRFGTEGFASSSVQRNTPPSLSVENLFGLELEALDRIGVNLLEEIKKLQTSTTTLLENKTPQSKYTEELEEKLAIIKTIITFKQDRVAKNAKLRETQSQKEMLESLLAQKQVEELKNLSAEEIQQRLNNL